MGPLVVGDGLAAGKGGHGGGSIGAWLKGCHSNSVSWGSRGCWLEEDSGGGVLVRVADRNGSGGAGMVVVVGWW